jgi:uroporphyrinogen-III synthase
VRVWVTRAQPQAAATAERLVQRGHEPVVQPLIETRIVPVALEGLAGAGALAFTSQTAIDAALSHGIVPALADLPVFAVGDATAEAAHLAGFKQVHSAAGTVTDLAALILSIPPSWQGDLVHLSARQPAGDLTGLLEKAGCTARRLTLYETIDAAKGEVPVGVEAILIHSAKAARRAAAMISPHEAQNMCLFGLSEAALTPLNAIKFRQRAVAPIANEASILSLLD